MLDVNKAAVEDRLNAPVDVLVTVSLIARGISLLFFTYTVIKSSLNLSFFVPPHVKALVPGSKPTVIFTFVASSAFSPT